MKIISDNDQLLVEFCFPRSGSICVKTVEMNILDQLRQAAADVTLGKMRWSRLMKSILDNDFMLLEPCFPRSGSICVKKVEMNILDRLRQAVANAHCGRDHCKKPFIHSTNGINTAP